MSAAGRGRAPPSPPGGPAGRRRQLQRRGWGVMGSRRRGRRAAEGGAAPIRRQRAPARSDPECGQGLRWGRAARGGRCPGYPCRGRRHCPQRGQSRRGRHPRWCGQRPAARARPLLTSPPLVIANALGERLVCQRAAVLGAAFAAGSSAGRRRRPGAPGGRRRLGVPATCRFPRVAPLSPQSSPVAPPRPRPAPPESPRVPARPAGRWVRRLPACLPLPPRPACRGG